MKKILALVMSLILVLGMGIVTVCAGSDDFVPSIEVKEAPGVVTTEGEDGVTVMAIITDPTTNTPVAVGELFITSLSEANNNSDAISTALVKAYNDVKNTDNIKDKIDGMNKHLNDLGFENASISVANVFDVSIPDGQMDTLNKDGASISIVFTNDVKATQGSLLVAHMVDNEWKLVDADNIKVDEKTITVSFDSLCPVMFMLASEGEPTVTPGGCNSLTIWIIIAVVAVVCAVAVALILLNKKKGK